MNLRSFPALEGWNRGSGSIATRRAVYGKVHRAPTDYRWLAWSDNFAPGPAPLEQDLALGAEDAAASFCCWRYSAAQGAIAVKCYPSRAFDAAGRPAGMEKQVLAAAPSADVPPALMAFLLLSASVQLDDTIWWDTWRDPRWKTQDYHLPIPADQCPNLSFEELEPRVEQGVTELLDYMTEQRLEEFYARLLGGSGLVVLRAEDKLPTPLALAAMLLPLDRNTTGRISLAGGFPARTLQPERLGHWSAVVCGPLVVAPDTPVPEGFRGHAAGLVQMLKRSMSDGGRGGPALDLSPGGSFLLGFLQSEERWFVPGERGGNSIKQVGPWPVVRHPGEAEMLRESVAKFAAEVASMPNSPARRQLTTKADLLRALLLVLCPGSESLNAVPRPFTNFVPPLYFASRIEAQDWSEFARYTAAQFEELAVQSLRHTLVHPMVEEVASWLRACAERPDAGPVQGYARHANGAR